MVLRSIRPVPIAVLTMLLAACSGVEGSETSLGPAAIDQARLEAAGKDDDNWLTYGRTYDEQRYSRLTQINDGNIGELSLAWALELDTARGQEGTPIVVDGVMYTSTAWSKVVAIDAATGKQLWQFDPENEGSKAAHACCDVVNRGVAVWKGRVFVGTIDGRLIAIDAKTGQKVWETITVDQKKPYTITMAPRVVRDKVIIGNSGAELGVRGYVSAYDTNTGKLVWRFYTVPGNPKDGPDGAASDAILEKLARPTWYGENYWKLGGGGTVWDSVVYDQELNQLLIGVGNGSPWNHKWRSAGKGDNLFLSSILALDPDTGAYKWHYQINPGETWDYTATQQIMLADLKIDGRDRKVLMQAPKNAFFYVIDRTNGKLISAKPYARQNWAEGIDLKTGRPIEKPGVRYDNGPALVIPSGIGAHAWMPMSYSPKTGLVYIPAMEHPLVYGDADPFVIHEGRWNTAVSFLDPPAMPGLPDTVEGRRKALESMVKGKLVAYDPVTQKPRWEVERDWPWNGGTLATAGNLVFQGTPHGDFEAFSADNGKKLWSFQTHRGVLAGPITYRVNGEQYIAVMAGYGGSMGMASGTPFMKNKMPNGLVLAFKIKGNGKLPPYTPIPQPEPTPSNETFTAAQIATGQKGFFQFCQICHGGPVNPNLRRSPLIADKDLWQQVVIGGALAQNGMASFAAYLKPEEAEAIRAYLNQQAKALLAEEKAKAR
ncbi:MULTISPECIES: PQQ-dependent dehydrogenase, methanol/ethanol family [Sphingobium]|uniref:PQQ-dependent dehydrogenase, methanol/ethanol family n=2 Tax=Sphingomonadaceae TaxID=41297 RepID=UPI0015EC80F1|nr:MULTISPECIES: PQQ-dependent dehydrogenase, methanol/ethanol family [Sphingobium]MCW2364174.1 PQQ-dependent dehydrogenase (methanol/ethanol family) [Sphingobium sp. B10D3B]MCW2402429.1 PQQ-dependent dehydrogenase (methanol/ethanol family) [Sphingobium sp. B10D7B]MCW2409408.1 PQQ-dependent dehydrogenase (methanol/ethanol family) [Sphingobium xanthum]